MFGLDVTAHNGSSSWDSPAEPARQSQAATARGCRKVDILFCIIPFTCLPTMFTRAYHPSCFPARFIRRFLVAICARQLVTVDAALKLAWQTFTSCSCSVPISPGATHQIVQDYLRYYGYGETLQAFDQAAGLCEPQASPSGRYGQTLAPSKKYVLAS